MDRRERFALAQARDAPAILSSELVEDTDARIIKPDDPFEMYSRRSFIMNQYFHQSPFEPSPEKGPTAQRKREQPKSREPERRHRRARNFEKHALDFDPVAFDADLSGMIQVLSR